MTPSEKLEEIERVLRHAQIYGRQAGDESEALWTYQRETARALTLARELREGATETSILRCTGPCGNTGWSSVICDCGAMATEAVPSILITGDAET